MNGVTAPRRIAGLVLAAGAGRRFGAPKQLAELDGRPLLEHALEAIAAVPALERAAVTLGAHADEILARVELHGVQPVLVDDWAEGQAASLRAGVAALAPYADAIVVTLGDQPRLAPATIVRLLDAWDGEAPALRASHDGRPGHPVLLTRPLYPAVARLRGDVGARSVLAAAEAHTVDCGADAVLDVDTQAQLATLRLTGG
jgi:molybdenum cofactor cytidylyltransferase